MGTSRPVRTSERDSLGRTISVSAAAVENRATAPAPAAAEPGPDYTSKAWQQHVGGTLPPAEWGHHPSGNCQILTRWGTLTFRPHINFRDRRDDDIKDAEQPFGTITGTLEHRGRTLEVHTPVDCIDGHAAISRWGGIDKRTGYFRLRETDHAESTTVEVRPVLAATIDAIVGSGEWPQIIADATRSQAREQIAHVNEHVLPVLDRDVAAAEEKVAAAREAAAGVRSHLEMLDRLANT